MHKTESGFSVVMQKSDISQRSPPCPCPHKVRQVQLNTKSLLVICLDCKDILHQELVSLGQVVDQHCYWEGLQHLRVGGWEGSLLVVFAQWQKKNWLIHNDIVLVHTALSVEHFLATKNMAVPPNPPYSPDLAPCDFLLLLE
jgi:hypothetical protein